MHKCFVSIFVAWALCVGALPVEEIFSETLDRDYKEGTSNEGFADRAVFEGMSLNAFEGSISEASERCGFPRKITAYAIRSGTISKRSEEGLSKALYELQFDHSEYISKLHYHTRCLPTQVREVRKGFDLTEADFREPTHMYAGTHPGRWKARQ